MKVINLFGGPGSGKSTTAAGVFSLLKLHGINCELVTEFAKDLVWEEHHKTLQNQLYILGKQQHRLWRLKDLVDYVITDSPIILGYLYTNDLNHQDIIIKEFKKFDNINFFIKRVKPYNPKGRYQSEVEAKEIDEVNKSLLGSIKQSYDIKTGDFNGINLICKTILTYEKKELEYIISNNLTSEIMKNVYFSTKN